MKNPWVHLHHSEEKRRPNGLYPLLLDLYDGGQRLDRMTVNSGQPWAQNFRLAADSQPGSFEPIPEGLYSLGLPDWVAGEGNWGAVWSDALGPFVCDIVTAAGTWTRRSELRVHMDWNDGAAPGTAGCVGLETRASAQRYLTWRKQGPLWVPLYTDWGLGSIHLPDFAKPTPAAAKPPVKIASHDGRSSALVGGKLADAVEVRLKRNADGSVDFWLNDAKQPEPAWTDVRIGLS